MPADPVYPGLLPIPSLAAYRQSLFHLTYIQHGGSGLGWNPEYVAALDWSEMQWYCRRLEHERQREAKAIKGASSTSTQSLE